jgi:hypothetical protein
MMNLQEVIETGRQLGVTTYLLPFALVFATVYAILRKSRALGGFHATDGFVAGAVALLAIGGHAVNLYPDCWDFVTVINNAIPKVGILILAGVLIMIGLGLFGAEKGPSKMSGLILILIMGFVAYAFLTSGGPGCNRFDNLVSGFSLNSLLPIIMVIIVIIFIVILVMGANKNKNDEEESPHSH